MLAGGEAVEDLRRQVNRPIWTVVGSLLIFWGPDRLWYAYGSATHIFLQLVATCVYFAASVPAWLTEEFFGRDRLLAPATPLVVSAKITVPDQTKIMSSYKPAAAAHARGGAEVITHLAATLAAVTGGAPFSGP